MARPYSVLSQVPPRATKPKPEAVETQQEVTGWRARPLDRDPFGAVIRPFYGTEDEVRAWAAANPEVRPAIECLIGSLYGAPARQVPTVADLAHQGMAHQTADGKAWTITPLGQYVLTDAMTGLDE